MVKDNEGERTLGWEVPRVRAEFMFTDRMGTYPAPAATMHSSALDGIIKP